MKEPWKWDMLTTLKEYYVHSSHYYIDEEDGEESKKVYDIFEVGIVSNPKFEDFYKFLKYGENLYRYFHTFLPNDQDVLYMVIKPSTHEKSLEPKSFKFSLKDNEKYSDFLLRNINEFFKESLPALLKSNARNPRIYASIYRKRKVDAADAEYEEYYSDSFYEYIILEIVLNLHMKEGVI